MEIPQLDGLSNVLVIVASIQDGSILLYVFSAASAQGTFMEKRAIFGSVVILGGALLTVPAFADSSVDCSVIAKAKYQQWEQPRLLIDRSKTFEDGTTRTDMLIVTERTAYKEDGGSWTSAAISLPERAIRSPDDIMRAMRLGECSKGQSVQVSGQSATVYNYTYTTDANGYTANGTMWISDTTGLPVREDFAETAPPANAKIAKAISATYLYNADVVVPGRAEVSESRRLNNNAAVVRNMQTGGGGLGGPQQ